MMENLKKLIALILSPSSIDAWLVFFCAMFVFQQGFLSNDDAFKYVNPILLFWTKYFVGSMAAGFLALKAFRMTSYKGNGNGNGNGNKNETGNTTILTK